MNEITRLRNRHNDFSDDENGEYEEQDGYELHQWYEAAGVWIMDYQERVQKAAAPLTRVNEPQSGQLDLVTAAKKAAHAAVMEHTLNHEAYEKLNVP